MKTKGGHVTREILLGLADRRLSLEDAFALLFEHVMGTCPECSAQLETFYEERQEAMVERALGLDPGEAGEGFEEAVARARAGRAHQRRLAERELAELLALPADERRRRLARGGGRFSSPELADLLIDQARIRVVAEPEEAGELAGLAAEVACRSAAEDGPPSVATDLLARATAHRANALRVRGELHAADQVMSAARATACDSVDPVLHAELDHLSGSLRKDERRFEEALELLDRSLRTYLEIDDRRNASRVLLNRADVSHHLGDDTAALEIARQAAELLEGEADKLLELTARHNVGLYLASSGRFAEARAELECAGHLYRRFPEYRLRREWLAGKISYGLGEVELAGELLAAVREGFLAAGQGYDAALVSLDLALLFLEGGRMEELRRLAEGMFLVFRAQDVHREAVAALLLFERAVVGETVTVEAIRRIAGYLEDARRHPFHGPEQPS